MTAPVLEIDGLSIVLPGSGRTLVDDVSISVGAGEMIGIAGESGSGKTVTAMTALGFVPEGARASGHVRLAGRDLLTMSQRDLRRVRGDEVAMIFQDPMTSLHPMLDIGTQLTEHVRSHRGLSKRAAMTRATELLELVRIPDPTKALAAFPHRFSGGMRQRIAIASALACDPSLLIADEVTTALDVTVQAGILHLLDTIRRETNMAVLFITHDLGVMNVVTDSLYVMYAGRVVEHGRTRDVLDRGRHPYTRALIAALPEAGASGQRLVPIPGEPASPERRPSGCAFHPRCTFAVDECRTDVPALVGVKPLAIGSTTATSAPAVDPARSLACHVDPFASTVAVEERR